MAVAGGPAGARLGAGISERPDFVAGNTRLRARVPALTTSTTGRDVAELIRAVPGAYSGAARSAVEVLTARYDLRDTLALLRGGLRQRPYEDKIGAVHALGAVTPTHAREVAHADDAEATVGRLVTHKLPDPTTAAALPAIWDRYQLHRDDEELEAEVATQAHRTWVHRLLPHARYTQSLLSLLAEERDRANLMAVLRVPADGAVSLLPTGMLPPAALTAATRGDWTQVRHHRPGWGPLLDLHPHSHRSVGLLELELRRLACAHRLRLLRRGDPFTVDVAVGYMCALETPATATAPARDSVSHRLLSRSAT